ncbi:MAG: M42 family metallopeptidase [Nitrososphaerales archaeon]
MTELRELLGRLSETFGPSGNEKAVRNLVREEIQASVDRIDVDAMGNLIAFKVGTGGEPRLRVMLAAHMDEVGFMITKVNKNGTLSFSARSIDPRLLLAKRLVIGDGRVPGIIGAPVPHLQKGDAASRVVEAEDLFIDIGASDDKAANGKIKVGDYATFATPFAILSEDPNWPTVRGKAFDDRVGCTSLIALLKGERYPVDVYGAFTVQEEVGLRGARVAGHRVDPQAAFALEGTVCDDLPRPPDEDTTPVTQLGAGPAITLMDRSMIAHPGLVRLLQETADSEGIRVQYKAPGLGGTDGGAIHLARGGVPSIAVAVPCRYIHGPASILNLNDLEATVRLMDAALRRISPRHLAR